MPRAVSKKKVIRLQERYMRSEGYKPAEIKQWRPILTAQIGQESGFQTNLGSSAGARDIAQFMPTTAPGYGVTLGDNRIKDDIRGQVRMMKPLLRQHGPEGALRGYNAGPGAIERSKGFAETNAYVKNVLGNADKYAVGDLGQGFKKPRTAGSLDPGVPPTGTPGSSTLDAKSAMLDALLDPRKGMGLLARFQERVGSGQYTTLVPAKINPGRMPKYVDPVKGAGHGQPGSPTGTQGFGEGGPRYESIVQQAKRIDKAKVPYLWGGGHQRRISGSERVTAMDCSGAVSRLLGINPMVASQFKSWGRAGKDPKGRFTVWAANDHVLVEIGGHFWGTSKSNPGGGAGWIPRSALGSSYLSRFTARHF